MELTKFRLLAGLSAAAVGTLAVSTMSGVARASRFLIYYGREDDDRIGQYRLVVLDSDIEADIRASRKDGALALGYLSLGEVHHGRSYFPQLSENSLLLGANPNWPDARFVDMRSGLWHERLTDEIVPSILARGFDGLFFDTLDNAEALERQDPLGNAGMVEGAAEAVRAIRRSFPAIPIMINRGYAVLPAIAGQFQMLLGESVRTTFDVATDGYREVPPDGYTWQVRKMREAKVRDPSLRLFSLDYWDPEDQRGIKRIYRAQRANGFVPYVATFDLNHIVGEP